MQNSKRLEAYARLVVEIGVNVQPGEPVMIQCPVEAIAFARLLAKLSYERGACDVVFNWRDDTLSRLRYDYAPLSTFEEIPDWAFDRSKYYYERGVNVISVASADPELLTGVDMKKIAAASSAQNAKFKPLQKYTMNDIVSWCVVAVPNAAWAKKVFPEIDSADAAVEALWETIFSVTRMNEPDPVGAWRRHIDTLTRRANKLNDYHFETVRYTASNGTDLEVRLPEKHVWMAATSDNAKGTTFLPNIPTEEIFTAPHRTGVNGTLVSSKPLAYNGQLIDDFTLTFKDGAVVDFVAKRGGHALKSLLEEDPNARYLGEIALVPYDSPISNSNRLFYNTLFDENASCHFAFGACYPTTFEGGTELTPDELLAEGGNDSGVHEDFMVGTADLSIVGITAAGEAVQIFKDGNFVI